MLIIEAKPFWDVSRFGGDLWRYRELLYFFTLRDIKLRYKQTLLGGAWAVLQPILASGVFSVFLGKLASLPSDGVPYPLFCFSAILPWNYFAGALVRCSSSLIGNTSLLTKVYFPRILFPVSSLIPGLIDFALGATVLLVLIPFFGYGLTLTGLGMAFLVTGILFLLSLGIGLWLSALNVRFRDVGNILPFAIQLGMFATPILYPVSLIPEKYRIWLLLNPVMGLVCGFRQAVLGLPIDWMSLGASTLWALVLLLTGGIFFSRMENTLADNL